MELATTTVYQSLMSSVWLDAPDEPMSSDLQALSVQQQAQASSLLLTDSEHLRLNIDNSDSSLTSASVPASASPGDIVTVMAAMLVDTTGRGLVGLGETSGNPLTMLSSIADMLGNVTIHAADNSTANLTFVEPVEPRFWALVLVVFPVITLFGNTLVVASVMRERALHTATNYFIVSLAVADLMVAVLVMPLGIYVEVNNQSWRLGDRLCDTWVAFDVFCCTASILHLVAISVDRFIAVTQPIKYAKHKSPSRVYAMIASCWLISAAICLPIPFVNYTPQRTETPDLCVFYNSDFIMFSSMGSFYIPCFVMTYLYWRIFHAIWARARQMAEFRQGAVKTPAATNISSDSKTIVGKKRNSSTRLVGTPSSSMRRGSKRVVSRTNSNSLRKEQHQQPSIRVTAADTSDAEVFVPNSRTNDKDHGDGGAMYTRLFSDASTVISSAAAVGDDNAAELTSLLRPDGADDAESGSDSAANNRVISNRAALSAQMSTISSTYCPTMASTSGDESAPFVGGTNGRFNSKGEVEERGEAIELETLDDEESDSVPSELTTISRLVVLMAPADHISRARQRIQNILRSSRRKGGRVSSKKEKKATKTLAIVLVIFLICWVPFFTINIINSICIRYDLLNTRPECNMSPILFSFFVWLGYINSALNPIIYTIFNLDFRRAFKHMLFPVKCS